MASGNSSFKKFLAAQAEFLRRSDIAWSLAKRELMARYRGSILGFLWTFVEPFLLICIFFFVFVIIFNQQKQNYLLYLACGLLPYSFFSNAVSKATVSIVGNTSLIRQIYCPRQVFVLVGVLSELYHFCFSLIVLIPFYVYYRVVPGLELLAVIPVAILLALLSLGLGLFFASFNVFVRDTRFFVSLVLRMWFYMTPIFYSVDQFANAPLWTLVLYHLNPLVTALAILRWALIHEPFPQWEHILILLIEVVFALIAGSLYFYRRENDMVKLL